MADNTEIEWTDATWNPITGCSVVSPGCKHCYAMRLAGGRLRHQPSRRGLTETTTAGPVWNGRVRFNMEWLLDPLRWRRPRRIFVCAHGDLFHPAVPFEWIDHVLAVMALAPRHTFQVLTKRPERMWNYFTDRHGWVRDNVLQAADAVLAKWGRLLSPPDFVRDIRFPLPNVWLGVSIEDRARIHRIHALEDTPAALRFISFEPLLEDVCPVDLRFIDWAIVGGESGPRARPMEPEWVLRLYHLCRSYGVAFFFKQWGGPRPKSAGRLLGGVLHDEIPERSDDGRFIPPFRPKTPLDRVQVLPKFELDDDDLPF
ncbi:MAG: phage Gp37/Gp68 family protein [Alphaproteobacteria bacterium]|nr:phage Gp37/Gp68 family protein [Alphaproteobacteria bacterium]